jgi:hypothetical protein
MREFTLEEHCILSMVLALMIQIADLTIPNPQLALMIIHFLGSYFLLEYSK